MNIKEKITDFRDKTELDDDIIDALTTITPHPETPGEADQQEHILLSTKQIWGKRAINVCFVLGIITILAVAIYFYKLGVFTDPEKLKELTHGNHLLELIAFFFIQIIQCVIPILPGGISMVAGVMLFGPVLGFFANYAGIVIGSICIFELGRRFGKPLILTLVKEKTYNKYIGKLGNEKKFERFFTICLFFPFSPDDALCLIASLSTMSRKKFITIIILAKPLCILIYSLFLEKALTGIALLVQFIEHLF
ncbi:MAG: TVP38/TMEM64 family protein [Lactobacillales bacterium]|jgi:uncharacterized membrane protein YdjX (TVP38/TMEM64 family)|nr:TVP38/TMEM64 family protein [Lactobacillales bacterium]